MTQIPQAARTIAPVFQTVKEAEKWAVENKLADSVDYSKLPVGIANEINSALADFYTEYGVTLGKIGYRQNMDLYDNIMEVKRYKEGVIRGGELVGYRDMADLRINPVFFNNPNAKAILSRSYESGWAYSENIHDLITHEFGHIRTNTDDSRFLAGPGNIKTLSRYGQSSNSEAIAELFLKRRKFGDANLTPEEAQFLAQYTR